LNFHPLVQAESTGIHPQDLLAFVRSFNRQPIIADPEANVSSQVEQ
jgi:Ala-tRNA(Pro) deacylase